MTDPEVVDALEAIARAGNAIAGAIRELAAAVATCAPETDSTTEVASAIERAGRDVAEAIERTAPASPSP